MNRELSNSGHTLLLQVALASIKSGLESGKPVTVDPDGRAQVDGSGTSSQAAAQIDELLREGRIRVPRGSSEEEIGAQLVQPLDTAGTR